MRKTRSKVDAPKWNPVPVGDPLKKPLMGTPLHTRRQGLDDIQISTMAWMLSANCIPRLQKARGVTGQINDKLHRLAELV